MTITFIKKTYFISGHRDITNAEFQKHYAKPIMNALLANPNTTFILGDYYGVDAMAQNYLAELSNKFVNMRVIVYHMFELPRNNEHKFPVKSGFLNDHDRDSQMTCDSDSDIAWVRSGKSDSGTAQNVMRRKIKDLVHSMESKDALEFLQGIVNTSVNHPSVDKGDTTFMNKPIINIIPGEKRMNIEEEVSKTGFTIVKFYAEWCGPCKQMNPVIEKIAETPDVKVVSVNIEEHGEIVKDLNITAVPTLRFYKDGEYLGSSSGAMNEPMIRNAMNGNGNLEK